MPPPNTAIFTDAEIEKMRLFVTEHDKRASVNTFDLNNPPRTNYVHQHFPKLTYALGEDGRQVYKTVHNEEEHEAAIAAGWSNEPVPAEAPAEEIQLEPAAAAEAAAIDKQLTKKRTAKAK